MALNLVQHRGESNVWDRLGDGPDRDIERWLTAFIGGACLVSGLRQRSTWGLLMAVGGSALAWWSAAGIDQRLQWRGQVRAAMPTRQRPADMVGEASEESFPASDAPSWTPTTGNPGPCAAEALPGR